MFLQAHRSVSGAPRLVKPTSTTVAWPKFVIGTNQTFTDTGITGGPPFRGLLSVVAGPKMPGPGDMTFDVDKEALTDIQPLVDSMSTNLTTFSSNGGKLIFYHGDSDPWFSPLDTFGYYKDMAAANGGLECKRLTKTPVQ